MKHDNRSPCASCPYRKDARLRFWSKKEFDNLRRQERTQEGSTFGCHEHRKKPFSEHRPCVGWLLDQKRRGTRNIQLRLSLIMSSEARQQYEEINDNGHPLYGSIEEMIDANYGDGDVTVESPAAYKCRLKLLEQDKTHAKKPGNVEPRRKRRSVGQVRR